MDFSETIATCELKVCTCSQQNEWVKVDEYQKSRSFHDLGPRSFKTCFSQKLLSHLKLNFKWTLLGTWKCNFIPFIWVTWWRWLTCPYMVQDEIPLKNLLWNLLCSICNLGLSKFLQMMTQAWPWPILPLGQILLHMHQYRKKENYVFFRNNCSLWSQNWEMQSAKWVNEALRISKIEVWPRGLRLHFNRH